MKKLITVTIVLMIASSTFAGIMEAENNLFGSSVERIMQSGPASGGIGGSRVEQDSPQFSNMGKKMTAGALSLFLPGAGQYYNGDHKKAYMFAGFEAGVWAAYGIFDSQAAGREEDAREYAFLFADVSGVHADDYWRVIGRYDYSDQYNEVLLREARATGEEAELISGADQWQWRNGEYRRGYQLLRADTNRAAERRESMIVFAVLNRVVSIWDAVRSTGEDKPLATIGGYDLELTYSDSMHNPEAGWLLTRNF
ncbi:hypothetical protein HN388_03125 [bacterium]|nr:hypothetical protein [bacterium]MBT4292713.1 hypothetical protein [bacterium]MBT7311533.1 hypothetical protein [bacterium]